MQTDTATEILTAARALMMERGYNGFSFRDVAAVVGIKSASIHYHYPTKADLAEAAARDYRLVSEAQIQALEAERAVDLLRAYGALFIETLEDEGKACLGGVLAVDVTTLPPPVVAEVKLFFRNQERWVSGVLRCGQDAGEIRSDLDPDAFAALFVSALEGALMVARGVDDPDHLAQALEHLLLIAGASPSLGGSAGPMGG